MHREFLLAIFCALSWRAAIAGDGVSPIPTIRIADETVPPGETVQLKVYLDSPALLSSGVLKVDLDPDFFGDIVAASAFSGAADACGFAIISGRHAEIHFGSSTYTIGAVNGLPIATITAPLLSTVAPGATATVTADPGSALWRFANQVERAVQVVSGKITAGGRVSIRAVEPSSGVVPAGGKLRILGAGFDANTSAVIDGVVISSFLIVGPGEIAVTLGAPVEISGRRIRVATGDSGVDFFPALETDAVTTAPGELLANAHPILPLKARRNATTGGLARVSGWIVVHNPNAVTAEVGLKTDYYPGGYPGGVASIPPGKSVAMPATIYGGGGRYRLLSSVPVRSVAAWTFQPSGGSPRDPDAAPLYELGLAPLHILALPGESISFVWKKGSSKPAAQTRRLWLDGSEGSAPAFTVAVSTDFGNWLSVSPDRGSVTGDYETAPTISIAADPSSLAPGTYHGIVTITPQPPSWRESVPQAIPVVLTVTESETAPAQNVMACCYEFAVPSGVPLAYTYNAPAGALTGPFSVKALTDGGGNWLSASPVSATGPAAVTVSANPAGVPPGRYSGEVLITGAGTTIYMPIVLSVRSGVQLYPEPGLLQFSTTGSQQVDLSLRCAETGCPPVGVPTSFSWAAAVRTNGGGNWLETRSVGGKLMSVLVNASGLGPGIYTGAVTVSSSTANGVAQIPVVLAITQPELPALKTNTASFSFPGEHGQLYASTCVQAGDSQVPLTLATETSSGGNWLSALTPSTLIPCVVDVSVTPDGLAPGTYQGRVTVSAGGQSLDLPVYLTIPPAGSPPASGSIVNGASATEGAIAPGEILTLYADSFDFPAGTEAFADASQVRYNELAHVYFDGRQVVATSVGSGRVTVTAPRELATRTTTMLEIRRGFDVAYRGLQIAPASPGVYTLDRSGLGPAAALNQDNSVNTAVNPAGRGTVIQMFATGTGDGTVRATVGGIEAQATYSGPAPGAVDGLVQVNAVIPSDVRVGVAVPVVLVIGGRRSQDNVTIAVQN